MRSPVEEIVAGALTADGPAQARTRALEVVRGALGAEEVVLVRQGSAPLAHRSAARAAAATGIDAEALASFCGGDDPVAVGDGIRALALRPRADAPWCLAVARAGDRPWRVEDEATLAALGPALVLVLEHGVFWGEAAAERRRLAQAEAYRERSLRVLSHELRNPLAPILMWTGTLKRVRADDAEVTRAAQAIEHAVSLERRLIEDMIDVSRLEHGTLEVRSQPLDLRDVVWRAVELARPSAERGRLTLLDERPAEPVPVEGDEARLVQAVDNLLGNAVKFTPPGGTVSVKLLRRGDRAELRVSDSGPGLAPELRSDLFTPFVQGANARGGLGVGLAVARALMTLHRGTVEAAAEGELGGATFVVSMPLRPSWQSAQARA